MHGPWIINIVLTQYYWRGGELFLNTSTAMLQTMQIQTRARDHPALQKWEALLDIKIPDTVWQDTWLPF